MVDVVTIGETMIVMDPVGNTSLKYENNFKKRIAGAESNFAIGLAHLGIKAGWISKLGNDSFGDYIEFLIRGEGVDVSQVKRDKIHPTGLMVKEKNQLGETNVFYYRSNSAARHMTKKIVSEDYISQAKYLHLTGITAAISLSCRELIYKVIELAHNNGVKVVFDPNLRFKLWDKKEMKNIILDIIHKVDIVLPGISEARFLLEEGESKDIIKNFLNMGVELVVLKMGSQGAIAATNKNIIAVPAYRIDKVVDTVGAGDGFAAGFIAGQVQGLSLETSLKMANAVGAYVVSTKGDIEGLPSKEQLEIFLGEKKAIER